LKLAYPKINHVIEIHKNQINSIVIENPSLMYQFVEDMRQQVDKQGGKAVLSIEEEPVEIYKYLELITDVYHMDLNSKAVVTKLTDSLGKKAVEPEYYEKTMQLISDMQQYINDLVWDMDTDVQFGEISAKQILKAVNISFADVDLGLEEKIVEYLTIHRKFLGNKLFVFVNARSYISGDCFEALAETLIAHEFTVLFIDNKEYPKVSEENRWIIDIDLCEF